MNTTRARAATPARDAERESCDERRLPPFAGKVVEVVYDGLAAIDDYAEDGRTGRYEITAGPLRGTRGEARYEWREIAGQVQAISWQEADGASVVHVDDFARGTSPSFFTTPALAFYRLSGTVRPAAAAAG
ncbi:MoaF-related domain-containing protein [Tahibacter caeni]|uniref:MoaF-related domain-containing protein n=1 Tax=Tahibacter caeni TaxID=1453545 RepID=UPI00214911BF|nr:adenylate cyclase [Tahibacter caeni]